MGEASNYVRIFVVRRDRFSCDEMSLNNDGKVARRKKRGESTMKSFVKYTNI